MRMFHVFLASIVSLVSMETGAFAIELESRVILDGRFGWLTKASADATLKRIRAAGFNVFMPKIWYGAGTTWHSSLAPKDPDWEKVWDPEHPDPLGYLIDAAHSMEIEIHPWFTVSKRRRDFFPEFYDEGTSKGAFNVHVPEFRTFIVEIITEVARRYDVDGLNLDQIRARGVCQSESCINDYRRHTGRDLRLDYARRHTDKFAWQSIADWNAQAVDEIVASVSRQVRRLKPNIIVSVTSAPELPHFLFLGADSVEWVNLGMVDAVFAMAYRPPREFPWERMLASERRLEDPKRLIPLVANYEKTLLPKVEIVPRDANLVTELVEIGQNFPVDGGAVAVYQYNTLSDEQIRSLRSGPFSETAVPHWAWKQD